MSFDLRRRVVQEDPWDVSNCNIMPSGPTLPNTPYMCIRPPSLHVALNAFREPNHAPASTCYLPTEWASEIGRPQALTSTLAQKHRSQMWRNVLTNWYPRCRQTSGHSLSRQNENQDATSNRRVREEKEVIERMLDPSLMCILSH